MKIFFEELGIYVEPEYKEDNGLFTFLHQTHKNYGGKLFKKTYRKEGISPFEVIETFNSTTKKEFMADKLAARLFYFLFSNFIEEYVELTNQKYQKRIASTI